MMNVSIDHVRRKRHRDTKRLAWKVRRMARLGPVSSTRIVMFVTRREWRKGRGPRRMPLTGERREGVNTDRVEVDL